MADAQTIANDIGAALRDAESNAASEGATATQASLATLHAKLAQGFAHLRDVEEMDLDWDQIVGNPTGGKGAQPNAGGPKDPPPSED